MACLTKEKRRDTGGTCVKLLARLGTRIEDSRRIFISLESENEE